MATILTHSLHRPHGTIIISDPDAPGDVHIDVLTCCHCQRAWVYKPGSGAKRGFCMRCNRVTCGCQACEECVPFEKRLDLFEKGLITSL